MNEAANGLPGLRGTDHVSFTVPNLNEAVDFFVNVIGCEPFYDLGPFSADDDFMEKHLGVHPRAVMRKGKLLRCANGSNFELFEYESPDQVRTLPKNSDIGGHHVAFYVDDFDTAFEYLKSRGVRILGEPVLRVSGPSAGQKWVYFLSPWGMQFEMVSFPGGKAYEKQTTRRLWHPKHPDK